MTTVLLRRSHLVFGTPCCYRSCSLLRPGLSFTCRILCLCSASTPFAGTRVQRQSVASVEVVGSGCTKSFGRDQCLTWLFSGPPSQCLQTTLGLIDGCTVKMRRAHIRPWDSMPMSHPLMDSERLAYDPNLKLRVMLTARSTPVRSTAVRDMGESSQVF